MIGAPECYNTGLFSHEEPRCVATSVDIWSFGCVLSEALVWSVCGPQMLQSYREKRIDETLKPPCHLDLGTFYGGDNKVNSRGVLVALCLMSIGTYLVLGSRSGEVIS